jgi:hypothetical protein
MGWGSGSHLGGVAWACRWNPAPSAAPRARCGRRAGVLLVVCAPPGSLRGYDRPLLDCVVDGADRHCAAAVVSMAGIVGGNTSGTAIHSQSR